MLYILLESISLRFSNISYLAEGKSYTTVLFEEFLWLKDYRPHTKHFLNW